jgi:hypothetical protein
MALVDRLGREEESAAGAGLLLRRLGHGYNRGLRGANRQGKRLNSGSADKMNDFTIQPENAKRSKVLQLKRTNWPLQIKR